MSALVQMLRKRLMTTWLWQALFVAAVIGGFVSHYLTVQENDAAHSVRGYGFSGHVLSG